MSEQSLTLEKLAAARNAAAEKVTAWMHNEGMNGVIRMNHQAPAWSEYEATQRALNEALARVPPSAAKRAVPEPPKPTTVQKGGVPRI